MAKRLLRFTALLAVAAMLMAMAACNSAAPATTPPAPGVSAPAGEPTPAPAPEPVTLKYWAAVGATGTSGIHDDPIMQELTKRTGITLDIVFNLTADQISAMVASSDLPDALNVWIAETTYGPGVPSLLAANDMIDMEPLLAGHGQEIAADRGKVQYGKDFLSNGAGKLYFIPSWGSGLDAPTGKTTFNYNNGLGISIYLRWDLYKQAGYPELKGGLNDIIPILKQMQDLQPTTADGKKVYGLSPWFADWGLWNFTVWPEGLSNLDAEEGGFVDINPVDNSITSQIGDTNSTLWQGARFYFLANQAGVLDPDSVMQKYDQYLDKLNTGRILMGPCAWAVSSANGSFAKAGAPEKGFMPVKLPSSFTQVCNLYQKPFTDRWAQGITVKSKTPERAMDLLNFLNSDDGMRLLVNGIEGVNWNVGSDGVPHLTPDTLTLLTGGASTDLEKAGLTGYTHLYGKADSALDHKYNTPINFKYNEDPAKLAANATPYEQDFMTHYGVAYPDQLWMQTLPNQGKIYDGQYLQMVEAAPDDIKQIDTNLTNYLLQNLVKIVMATDENEYQTMQAKIIADCKNIGYETAYNWHKAAYEASLAKQAAFYDKIK